MPPTMIESFTALFNHLEDFCTLRGDPVANPRHTRWVRRDSDEAVETLKHLTVEQAYVFSESRMVAWATVRDEHYICLVGFDAEIEISPLWEREVDSGFSVALLSQLRPRPRVNTAQVRNVVEAGSKEEGDYSGHDARHIEDLFPKIRIYQSNASVDEDVAWRLYLRACTQESREGDSWIGDELADSLDTLARLEVPVMPYFGLCQSIFDADRRTMFLSIYRCIEATYAFYATNKLRNQLSIPQPWEQVAEALSNSISWRAPEAQSLNQMLDCAIPRDLEAICKILHVDPPANKQRLSSAAGKAIYELRNRIVHYRPGTSSVRQEEYDWNELCRVLTDITFHVFTEAYAHDTHASRLSE